MQSLAFADLTALCGGLDVAGSRRCSATRATPVVVVVRAASASCMISRTVSPNILPTASIAGELTRRRGGSQGRAP